MKIPCKDCLLVGICLQKYKKTFDTIPPTITINFKCIVFYRSCELLHDFVRKDKSRYSGVFIIERIKETLDFYENQIKGK